MLYDTICGYAGLERGRKLTEEQISRIMRKHDIEPGYGKTMYAEDCRTFKWTYGSAGSLHDWLGY
jgi:hypothetical protein